MMSKRTAIGLIAVSFPLAGLLSALYPGSEVIQGLLLCIPLYQWSARDLEEHGLEPRSTSLPLLVALLPVPGIAVHCFRSRRPRAAFVALLWVGVFMVLCIAGYEAAYWLLAGAIVG